MLLLVLKVGICFHFLRIQDYIFQEKKMNPNTKKITPVFTPFIEGKWGDYSVKDMSVSLTKIDK